jgi:hypothetical protein
MVAKSRFRADSLPKGTVGSARIATTHMIRQRRISTHPLAGRDDDQQILVTLLTEVAVA